MYEQLDQDLHHLLITSKVITEHEQECELIQKAGDTIDKTVKARQWLARMIRWGEEDAQAYIDWMQGRIPARIEERELEHDPEIARIAQHFVNGESDRP